MVTVEVVYTRICLRLVLKLSNAQLDEARGHAAQPIAGNQSPLFGHKSPPQSSKTSLTPTSGPSSEPAAQCQYRFQMA